MKTMKRALSIALAVLLVVAALPLSASAATTGKVASIGVKIVDVPNTKDAAVFSRPSAREDNLMKQHGDGVVAGDENGEATEADFKAAFAELDTVIAAPKWEGAGTEASPYQIGKGSKFYIAIDMNVYAPNNENGGFTMGTTPVLQAPKDAITVNTKSVGHPAAYGKACNAYVFTDPKVGKYLPGATGFTMVTAAYLNEEDKDGNATDRWTNQFSGGSGYIPVEGAWEVLIEATASGAAGKYYIEIAPEKTNSNAGQVTAIAYNQNGRDLDSMGDSKGTANDGASTDNIDFGDRVYFEIVSNDPKISIAANQKLNPVDTAKITVTLKNGKWATAPAAADFSVMDGSSPVAGAVTAVTRKSDTEVELTIKGSALDSAKNYTIKAAAATHTSTSGDPTAEISTTETFTVKPALTGTVTLDKMSPVYGETITATYSGGNATTAKYTWTVGGAAAKGTANGNKYTPAASEVGKKIKCAVSDSTGNAVGTKEVETTANLAAKALTLPAAAKITNVPGIKQGATNLTVSGTYTFTTSEGLVGTDKVTVAYDATYKSSATQGTVNDVEVTLKTTLSGAQASAYTFAGGKVTGVKGEVSEAKYTLNTTGGTATYSGDNVTGTTVSNLGGKVTGTVTAASLDGGILSDVKVTGASATGISITNNGADGSDATFEFTLPATTDVVSVTVALTIGKGVTTVSFDNLNKTYDGTTEFKGQITTPNVTLADFGITGIEYATADAGDGIEIKVTPASALGTEKEINGENYKFPATLSGNIEKADANTITADVPAGRIPDNADKDAVIAAIKNAPVMVEGFGDAQGTVGTYFSDADIEAALKDLGEPIYTASGESKEPSDNTFDGTEDVTVEGEVVKGSTWTLPAGVKLEGAAVDTSTTAPAGLEFILNDEGDTVVGVKVVGEVTAEVKFVVGEDPDEKTLTIPALTPVEPVAGGEEAWDFSSLAGQDLKIDLTFAASADGATALGKNFNDVTGKTVKVTAPINRKGQPVTSGISFDTMGYGKAEFEEGEVDADGLIVALPKVTNVVKGAEFVGWSVDGSVEKIVDIKTYKPDDGTTLIAAFRGYMVGDGDGKVRPSANVTRAELLKMLVVASGVYDPTKDYGKPSFTDVGNAWYTSYIACAEEAGITVGDGDGKVRPNAKITREEASIMIAKAFGVKVEKGGTTDKISDFDKVSSWAKDYVAALCNNGTINGYNDGTFRAGANIKRMESATMTNHYLGLTAEEKLTIKNSTDIKNPFTDIVGDTVTWSYADLMFASLSVPATFYGTEITMPEAAE